jgi:hypothetical protein
MRFAGQASRSNKFSIFLAADNRNSSFLDLEGYLRKARGTHHSAFLWEYYGNSLHISAGFLWNSDIFFENVSNEKNCF